MADINGDQFPFKTVGKMKVYYTEEKSEVLYIFKSGWKGLFHVILENGANEETTHEVLPKEEIEERFGMRSIEEWDSFGY